MANTLTLISHALCPYVQRAAIALAEKGIAFERIDIDLANKPAWLLQVSPLGKTPVLLIDGEAIFESAVICEYLDDTTLPRLHPENALQRARHRAWMEFGSATLNTIAGFYSAQDKAALSQKASELRTKFAQLEAQLGTGPYFAGERFSLVDAVFGPVFRYFDVLDHYTEQAFFDGLPKVQAWRAALALRPSVMRAVAPTYADLLTQFLRKRSGALAARMQGTHASPAITQAACTN
jgi:glutathione S-transferase